MVVLLVLMSVAYLVGHLVAKMADLWVGMKVAH